MDKITCARFGSTCPYADGEKHKIASLTERREQCEFRDEVGGCMAERAGGGGTLTSVRAWLEERWRLIGAALGGVVLLGALVWGAKSLISDWVTPKCEPSQLQLLIDTNAGARDFEKIGLGCLRAARANKNIDQMAAATVALRLAADKKSTKAAFELARLFDPLAREALEKDFDPKLLPAPNAILAVQFYDKAQNESGAKAAAQALRTRFNVPQEAQSKDGMPLSLPGSPGVYQRVIAKPGAVLVDRPGTVGGTPVQLFDILYVYGVKPGWRQVGHDLQVGPEGWVAEQQLQPWNVMLVMQYAPKVARNSVLFFRDETSVAAVVGSNDAAARVNEFLKAAKQSGPLDPRLVAVENDAIDWSTTPYMMPILSSSQKQAPDGRWLTLAEVGSVAGLGGPPPSVAAPTGSLPPAPGAPAGADMIAPDASLGTFGGGPVRGCRERSGPETVHQIVFVMDTTSSMGPYITGAKRIVDSWATEIERRGLSARVRFGLVAYRNNMDEEPQRSQLEYVVNPILPLSASSDAAALSAALGRLGPAKVSTHSFSEDATAGLYAALNSDSFRWQDSCGAKSIFLITDAGALASNDPKSLHPGVGLATLAAQARDKKIDIFPVHIATPEAREAGNIDGAADQYRRELNTTDNRVGLYQSIQDGSPAAFDRYLHRVDQMIAGIALLQRNAVPPQPNAVAADGKFDLGSYLLGKLFAVQQRFLGAAAGARVPTFVSSWTSNVDLANPNVGALRVSVLLTRRQLNQLAEKTQMLISAGEQARQSSSDFFKGLQVLAAATSQDPARFARETPDLGGLMPTFLKLLPYKSDILKLGGKEWRELGADRQRAYLAKLQQKRSYYLQVVNDGSRWTCFGNNCREDNLDDKVALIPLDQLP